MITEVQLQATARAPHPKDRIYYLTTVLFLFNFVVFVSGIACMGMSAWMLATTGYITALLQIDGNTNMPSLLHQCSFALLFVGIVLFIVSIIGITAVYVHRPNLIRFYTSTLLLIVVLELTIAVVISLFQGKIKNKLKLALYRSLGDEYTGLMNSTNRFTYSLDWAMVKFECCGILSYKDFRLALQWHSLQKHEGLYAEVPDTCCKFVDKSFYPTTTYKLVMVDRKCPVYPTIENSWKTVGCYSKLQERANHYIKLIIGFGSTLFIIQVVGIVCSLFLAIFLVQRKQLYGDLAAGNKITLTSI